MRPFPWRFWTKIPKAGHLTHFGVVLVKDWRNRDKWPAYRAAVDEMRRRTNTPTAPWTIIESNCKWHARVKALECLIAALEQVL